MWITGDVNLPEDLLEAQQDGRLVGFVGAGASAGSPSNLPIFVPLTRQIATDAQVPWDDKAEARPDWFLGKLSDQGIAVHELVKNKVADSRSRPNQLHDSIV